MGGSFNDSGCYGPFQNFLARSTATGAADI
jgi:hypothetical protein